MKLIDNKGIKYKVQKAKSPKFSEHRGRTWDYELVILNEVEMKFWLDTTWGFYYYFKYEGVWYKAPIYDGKLDLSLVFEPKYKEQLTFE